MILLQKRIAENTLRNSGSTRNGFDFLSVKKTPHLFRGRVLQTRIRD